MKFFQILLVPVLDYEVVRAKMLSGNRSLCESGCFDNSARSN